MHAAAPESGFDCSSCAQDQAGAELLKFMLVPMPRNRPTPSQILAMMGTLGLRHAPRPPHEVSSAEKEQLAQARSENEALNRSIEALKRDLADANARRDGEGLVFEPMRAHRELIELRNTHARAAAQQMYTPTRSEGSPDPFVPTSEREGLLSTRLREAETEAAWRETRAALQRETEAAWRETQAALREKEVKEAESRTEREAARKEIAAVREEMSVLRTERDATNARNLEEVAIMRAERDAAIARNFEEIAVLRAERDTAIARNFEEIAVLRAERDAALKEAA